MRPSGRGRDSEGAGPSTPPVYGAAPSDVLRECGCPEYVVGCAHSCEPTRRIVRRVDGKFAVWQFDTLGAFSVHDTYAEAETEFAARAEALGLGGCDE